jgi:YD repeat-containing protein
MTEIVKHRIYEQGDAPADLTGYYLALDKQGEAVAKRISAERLVSTQIGEVVGNSIVRWDPHIHIVTQAEATGGDFVITVPNTIEPTRAVIGLVNQLPIHDSIGFTFSKETATREVTIHKNNTDIYFPIKAGWPIYIGYYYKTPIPGSLDNPPEEESTVALASITHQAPDDDQLEYDAQNNVKFILHFTNTGSAAESLNLNIQLNVDGSGANVGNVNITHEVVPGGNTYEITYNSLGNVGSTTKYNFAVSGDRSGTDTVTVPAKVAVIALELTAATRVNNTTVQGSARAVNTGNDSGTKDPMIFNNVQTGAANYLTAGFTFTGVDINAHTVTLYDSNGTTVIATIGIDAITSSNVILDYTAIKNTSIGLFTYDGHYSSNARELGYWAGALYGFSKWMYNNEVYLRLGKRIYIPTNLTGITDIKITIGFNEILRQAEIDNFGLYKHNSDIETCSLTDLYNNIAATDLIDSVTQYINALTFTLKSAAFTYFQSIAAGYVDLMFAMKSTDPSLHHIPDISLVYDYFYARCEITKS